VNIRLRVLFFAFTVWCFVDIVISTAFLGRNVQISDLALIGVLAILTIAALWKPIGGAEFFLGVNRVNLRLRVLVAGFFGLCAANIIVSTVTMPRQVKLTDLLIIAGITAYWAVVNEIIRKISEGGR
jgi:hypothetical protein